MSFFMCDFIKSECRKMKNTSKSDCIKAFIGYCMLALGVLAIYGFGVVIFG